MWFAVMIICPAIQRKPLTKKKRNPLEFFNILLKIFTLGSIRYIGRRSTNRKQPWHIFMSLNVIYYKWNSFSHLLVYEVLRWSNMAQDEPKIKATGTTVLESLPQSVSWYERQLCKCIYLCSAKAALLTVQFRVFGVFSFLDGNQDTKTTSLKLMSDHQHHEQDTVLNLLRLGKSYRKHRTHSLLIITMNKIFFDIMRWGSNF